MKRKELAKLSLGTEEFIEIPLETEGDRESATILIDGVFYHFERVKKEILQTEYRVDNDPDYEPQTDDDGYCYIFAPFCK